MPHLYPLGEYVVVVVDAVSEFSHIGISLSTLLLCVATAVLTHKAIHFASDTVDERHDAIGQRHLGTLFQIALLVLQKLLAHETRLLAELLVLLLEHLRALQCLLFPFLERFEQRDYGKVAVFTAAHAMEDEQQEDEQTYHEHNGQEHEVKHAGRVLQLVVAGFELTVLTRLLLHVEEEVAVVVAARLIVDGRIDQAELFADAGHKVGCLVDGGVFLQRIKQADLSRLVVADAPEALCKRTIGTCRLIDIAIFREDVEGLLCQIACQQRVGHVHRIDECECRRIVGHKPVHELYVLQMLAHALQSLRLEERIAMGHRQLITPDEVGELHIGNSLSSLLLDNSTCSNVVEVVQKLCCVGFEVVVGIDMLNGIN